MRFSEKPVATKDQISFPDRRKSPWNICRFSIPIRNGWCGNGSGSGGMDFAEALLDSQNRIPTLTVRSNPLKTDRAALIRRLAAERGVVGRPTPYSPQGIRLEAFRGRVDQGKAFQEGLFQVQDEAAQLTSIFVSPRCRRNRPGSVCGLWGKDDPSCRTHGGSGKVIALDMNRTRLVSLATNAVRLGIGSVVSVAADASERPFLPFPCALRSDRGGCTLFRTRGDLKAPGREVEQERRGHPEACAASEGDSQKRLVPCFAAEERFSM